MIEESTLTDNQETQSSIVKRIIDGSVTIDSVEDFENIINIFQDDPGVYRAFADLLTQKKSFDAAATAFRKASRLFIDLGMMMPAIVSKILEWRIAKPSHREARAFYGTLQGAYFPESPSRRILSQLAYPEMVAFMGNLVRLRVPAGQVVKACGDAETDIYFVVSGTLRETIPPPSGEGEGATEESTTDLMENDFFGNVFPFHEQKTSPSTVESVTRVELVKISQERLKSLCTEHPNVELLVKDLCQAPAEPEEREISRRVRKTARHQIPTKVRMKIFPENADQSTLVVDGFTDDISMGGACLVLSARYRPAQPDHLLGRTVKIEMSLPEADTNLNVLGSIVWSKDVQQEDETTTAVGIQFQEMDEKDRTALDAYCCGSDGEQNLIWSLWESYVKP